MTDREKVVNGLECCLNGPMQCEKCRYRADDGTTVPQCVKTLREDAIALLKAQEPVRPFVTGNGHTFEEAETWWYECGNCKTAINPNDKFCHECGRAVKWDE